MIILIYYEHRMHLVFVHNALNLRNLGLRSHHLWGGGHDVANGLVEELCLPFLHGTADIAIGNQADDTLVFIKRDSQSQFALAHVDDSLTQVHILRNDRHIVAAHHIFGGGKESLTQFAARMELGKVARLEVAYLHQGYCQGIAHRQSRSGTAGRGEVQRTSLLLHLHGDMMVGIFRQQGIRISRNRNNRYIHVKHHRDETEQFIGLTAVAQCQHHTEVAMIYIQRIDIESRRTC